MRRTSPRRRTADLMTGAALGCLLAAAAPALAAEPSSTPIRIESDAPITIDAGQIATTSDDEDAVLAILDAPSPADGLDIVITGESISTSGVNASAITAVNNAGDITIDVGQIATTGESSNGVWANAKGLAKVQVDAVSTQGDGATGLHVIGDGGVSVEIDAIETEGVNSSGVMTYSDFGAETVLNVGRVSTLGAGSLGIDLNAMGGGAITLTGGSVTTKGQSAVGVLVYQRPDIMHELTAEVGAISVDLDSVETGVEGDVWSGAFADAVRVDAHGYASVVVDRVTTHGEMSRGVTVQTIDGAYVQVGQITTAGGYATGVDVYSEGDVRVDVGQVVTRGDSAFGIVAASDAGSSKVSAETILTEGNHATGVSAHSQRGDVVVAVGDLTTRGTNSTGIRAAAELNGGRVLVQAGEIITEGEDSTGVAVRNASENEAAVIADAITTRGARARGVDIAATGNIRVAVGALSTKGEESDGVFAVGEGRADIGIEAGAITTEGRASAGMTVIGDGDVTIKAGDIRATGAEDDSDSVGVRVEMGAADGVLILEAGAVTTRGLSRGVEARNAGQSTLRLASASAQAASAAYVDGLGTGVIGLQVVGEASTTGADSHALHVVNAAEADIRAGSVRTTGDRAAGVKVGLGAEQNPLAPAGANRVRIEANEITTEGVGANGVDVDAVGEVTVAANRISTFGVDARAIRIATQGAAIASIGDGVASGVGGVGVEMVGATVGLTVNGMLRGIDSAARLTSDGAVTATVVGGARVSGGREGLRLNSGTGSTVTNAGAIEAEEGLALDIKGGAATIANRGLLAGRIDLTAAADTLSNEGTFRLRGDSDFGAGVDTLANSGTLSLAESATPAQVRLRNLERLNNTGTINLSNGVAGDVLTLDGVLTGGAGNLVRMDLDTRSAVIAADRLVVGGLEGQTNLRLEILGTGVLGETGVTLVSSAGTQTGAELSITTSGGFLEYDAVFDAASREYRIVGAVDEERAWEPTKVASGGQTQWRRGADVITARFDELRDGAALGLRRGERAQAWAQAFGGSSEIDGRRTLDGEAVNLSHDVDVAGAQMGVDIVRGMGGGDLVLGGAASYGETRLTFASNGDRADFTGWGLAAYAQWSRGPLSLGLTVKGDQYELEYDWGSVDLADTADGQTVGARLDAAWRIEAGSGWRIEPQASLSWTDTDLDAIEAEAGEVEFGDTTSVLGKVGVRLARGLTLSNGAKVQPYVGVYGFNEFDGDNASRIHLSSETIAVADRSADLWGEAVLGANLAHGPIQIFAQGEASFGEIQGFTARIGARLNW